MIILPALQDSWVEKIIALKPLYRQPKPSKSQTPHKPITLFLPPHGQEPQKQLSPHQTGIWARPLPRGANPQVHTVFNVNGLLEPGASEALPNTLLLRIVAQSTSDGPLTQ